MSTEMVIRSIGAYTCSWKLAPSVHVLNIVRGGEEDSSTRPMTSR